MSEQTKLKILIRQEACCDTCNQIIHNHLDCPTCGREFAATDSFYNLFDDAGDCTVKCCECGAQFHSAGEDPYDDQVEQWERVEAGHLTTALVVP